MYKILLVEDDEIISKSIKQYLENWDFEVKQARDFKNITNEFKQEVIVGGGTMTILMTFTFGSYLGCLIGNIWRGNSQGYMLSGIFLSKDHSYCCDKYALAQ